MSKATVLGAAAAIALVAVLAVGVYATTWDMNYEAPVPIEFDTPEDGMPHPGSLNYVIFEQYGPLLIVLAILMFGAMVGGICIAREDIEDDEEVAE